MTLKHSFVRLAVLLALLLTCCSKKESNSVDVEKQVKLIETALGFAQSWHISGTFGINGVPTHIDDEVGCPNDFHRVGKLPGRGYRHANETIAKENGFYYRDGNFWYGGHSTPTQGPTNYCRSGAYAGDSPLTEELDKLKPRASLKKGEVQSIDGALCREFAFVAIDSPHAILASLCIDEQTNLPYEYRYGDDVYRYSRWNEAVSVDAPPGF